MPHYGRSSQAPLGTKQAWLDMFRPVLLDGALNVQSLRHKRRRAARAVLLRALGVLTAVCLESNRVEVVGPRLHHLTALL